MQWNTIEKTYICFCLCSLLTAEVRFGWSYVPFLFLYSAWLYSAYSLHVPTLLYLALLQALLLHFKVCSSLYFAVLHALLTITLHCTVLYLLKALNHWSIVPALLCTGSHILEQSRCKMTVEWLLAMCGHHHHHCIVCVVYVWCIFRLCLCT